MDLWIFITFTLAGHKIHRGDSSCCHTAAFSAAARAHIIHLSEMVGADVDVDV